MEIGTPLTWEQCCAPVEEALANSTLPRNDDAAAAAFYRACLAEWRGNSHRRETMARLYGNVADLCCFAERRLNKLRPRAQEVSGYEEHLLYLATTVCTLVLALKYRPDLSVNVTQIRPCERICLLIARFNSRCGDIICEANSESLLRDLPGANLGEIKECINRWTRLSPKRPNAHRPGRRTPR